MPLNFVLSHDEFLVFREGFNFIETDFIFSRGLYCALTLVAHRTRTGWPGLALFVELVSLHSNLKLYK